MSRDAWASVATIVMLAAVAVLLLGAWVGWWCR